LAFDVSYLSKRIDNARKREKEEDIKKEKNKEQRKIKVRNLSFPNYCLTRVDTH
jgi:hypothetical protein